MNKTNSIIKPFTQLAIVLGITLLASSCATRDEDGNVVVSDRECRSTQKTGSNMRSSTCLSKAEWAVIDEREAERAALAEERADSFLREALINTSTNSPGRAFDTP